MHHSWRPLLGIALCLAAATVRHTAGAAGDVILRAADAIAVQGTWRIVPDSTAAGGSRLSNPDQGLAKPSTALASPANYVDLTFSADAGVPYHLWIRGRAEFDSYDNDSVYAQFSDTVTAAGDPIWRIGTNTGTSIVLEDCPGCGVSGWGWQDNNYGGPASPIYFATSGAHTLRIQVREDGLSIDQIVLSPGTYLTSSPGSTRNDTTILTGTGTPTPSSSASLVRGPYLQQVGDRSAVIVWASREPGPASARVGSQAFAAMTTFYSSATTGIADYYQHEAVVTGLQPASTYAYQLFVGAAAATSGGDQLTTAPATGAGRVRFIAFGDSGTGSPEQAALAGRMTADSFDLALHAGDVAYGNSSGTGDANYATYQSWFFDVYGWLRRRPIFPSMGNHDSRAGTNWGEAYLNLFVLPAQAGGGPYPDHAERYYSFDYGPVHFVALDTELAFQDDARRGAQLAWLDADLANAAAQPWKVAFFHRSPFSAGGEHGSDLAVRQAFAPLFERHGVQLVVSAHEHTYERSVPWRTGGNDADQAVTYVVAGGGGGPVYASGQDTWTARSFSEHHYVRVTIDGCLATIEAVHTTGALLDSSTLDRCAQRFDAGPPTVDFASLASGMTVQGPTSVDAYASDDLRVEKVDLWIDGALHSIDRTAPYSFSWDAGGAAAGPHTLELRAYDVDGHRASRSVVVNVGAGGSGSPGLPSGWLTQDVGATPIGGSASYSGGTFSVSASGADIWGTSDAFRFTYQSMNGDGAIVARVSSVSGSEAWAKAGVMIRAGLDPGAAHASMFASLGKGAAFQRRTTTGGASTHTAGPGIAVPYWVSLVRTGHVFTASVSPDGQTWSVVGTDYIPMPAGVLVGLAVTSHTTSALASAAFDLVSITAGASLPAPWRSDDVGNVGVSGSAAASSGTYTVKGAGADVWGTSDAFHFLSQSLNGDGTIVARVTSVEGTQAWTKVGVMMRSGLGPGAAHAFMLVSSAKGLAFQRRTGDGGGTTHTAAASAAARWVKLDRQGAVIVASVSTDGTSWTEVGRDTFALGPTLQVGLAVTSHDASQLATGTFDNVQVWSPP